MRVLLTGATGLIGAAVLARLAADGHEVIAVSRGRKWGRDPTGSPAVGWIRLDIGRATASADWLPHLGGIDAVVNCAGVLQDGPGDSTRGVHLDGISALAAACAEAGVRRFVQVSAIGVDREGDEVGDGDDPSATAFTATKGAGDRAVMAADLDWVVLRPSVVVGRAAFGGSALFRALAVLPLSPVVETAGPLQVIQLDDLVRTIAFFLSPQAPTRLVLELAGPERLALGQVIGHYRRWMGYAPAQPARLPAGLLRLAYAAGDVLGRLGWRTPLRTTAGLEMARGTIGDPAAWIAATGIRPQSLGLALAGEPMSVQERWFARLYLLKPLILGGLALFWFLTGLISLGPGFELAQGWLEEAGFGPDQVAPAAVATGLLDLVIGLAIAVRRTARAGLLAALAVSALYLAGATLLVPRLWYDPLGVLLKIWPILLLNLVALAVLDDR